MVRADGMETFAARLATFNSAHLTSKRRTSTAKCAKSITWPHSNPAPAELALAGFYYKPTSSSPDNAACFLCERSLDGWEEDDNPFLEHLKHSNECGWAIITSIAQSSTDQAATEDPMSDRMMEARRSTFASAWPHDGKRGWTCKTEKMVEAGWYFCPTPESEDFVTCAYCNLSLDGWEPKDNPFDEHQRRSPGCSFFASSKPSKPRGRKGRTSKASRLSTQSNVTAASEAPSIPDFEDSIDHSILSQDSQLTSAKIPAKGAKKGSKAKGKTTKGKKVESTADSSLIEVDNAMPPPQVPSKTGRGKKRTSDEMNDDDDDEDRGNRESTAKPEPPPKRRATRTRNSAAQQLESVNEDQVPVEASEAGNLTEAENEAEPMTQPKKGRPVGRKRGSSTARKVSAASTASKASLRSAMPDDSELDAALEADLNRPLTDDEGEKQAANESQPRKAKTKSKASAAASIASVRHFVEDAVDEDGDVHMKGRVEKAIEIDESIDIPDKGNKQTSKAKARKAVARRKEATKKQIHVAQDDEDMDASEMERQPQQMPTRKTRASAMSNAITAPVADTDLDSSMMTARTVEDDSGHETDASVASKSTVQRGGKKKRTTTKKKKGKKTGKAGMMSKHIEDIVNHVSDKDKHDAHPQRTEVETGETVENTVQETLDTDMHEPLDEAVEERSEAMISVPAPKQKAGRGKAVGKTNPKGVVHQTEDEILESPKVQGHKPANAEKRHTSRRKLPSSPAPSTRKSTPSPSPQSSDAENQPPSARPSATRPPLISASKSQTIRVPLAASTPTTSPSKRNADNGYLQTSYPWSAVDLSNVFSARNQDKENMGVKDALAAVNADLTSPEKRMTVEDWISWNAKNGEEKLRVECERLLSIFEREGGRAMMALEGIECIE